MAIKSGQPIAATTITATTDTTVTNSTTGETKEVYSLVVHETGGASPVLDLYLSSDATSASGTRIEQITLGANESRELKPVLVGVGRYLIIRSSLGNVNFHGAYTLRSGGDV